MNTKILSIAVFLMLFATLLMTVVFNNENTCLEEPIIAGEKSSRPLFDSIDWWTMYGHDLEHMGYSTSSAPETNIVNWTHQTSGEIKSSPAVVDDRVYISSSDNYVYCLDASNGDEIWKFPTDGSIRSSPAVSDGSVYIGSNDDNVYCLNADDGTKVWNYTTGADVKSSPAVSNGKVYIGSSDTNVYCLNAENGEKVWNYSTGFDIRSSPAVAGGRVYIGEAGLNGNVYCLNAENGTKIWNYSTNHIVMASPVIYNNKIYICSIYQNVYCLNAENGKKIWEHQTSSTISSSPAAYDNKIYLGSDSRNLYCLNAGNGSEIWSYETDGQVQSSPALADGKVYFGSGDNKVYCLDAETKEEIWAYETDDRVYSSPAIAKGKIYIGSDDSKVYCFGENQPPNKPARPVGPTEGEVNTEYTFSTTTTDPDGDQIYYWFDWGDNTNSGWITSSSKSHSWSEEGTYQIKVKAKDIHGAESTWSNPSTIDIVEQTTEEPEPKGWIFGSVYDAEGEPIVAASVCVVILDVKQCVLTDEDGLYQIYVEAGDHTVEVKKEGYETQTKTVTVIAYEAFNENFILEESGDDTEPTGETRDQIDEEIEAGNIGAEIIFQREEQQISHVEVRYADITITPLEVDPDNGKISLIVDGEEPTGKTIVVIVDRDVFTVEDVTVEYDGIAIREATSFIDIIDYSDDGALPEFYVITEQDQAFILLSIPHFSEHEITISSLAEAAVSITAIILYIVISAIVLFLFFSPMLANLLHIQRQSKRKK